MENFEYSIQLNNRDWTEFYLASEECSLNQPALATADEQLLSDLEEGETEENRLIPVRVGPVLAQDPASCLPRGHPLAEEVLSGGEDESNPGSVSRFVCNNNKRGSTAFVQPSRTGEGQLPCVTSKPLGSRPGLPGPATEREVEFAAKEEESGRGDRPMNPNCRQPAVAATGVRKRDLPKHSPGQEAAERPACALLMNLDTVKGMDGPVGENESAALCSESQHPKGDISQTASTDTRFPTGSAAVSENSDVLRDPAAYPSSVHFASPVSAEPGGAERLEKGAKPLQIVLVTQAPPFQEKPLLFHGYSAPVVRDVAPPDPLSERHGESAVGKESKRGENAVNLKDESGASRCKDVSSGVLAQLGSSPCDNVVQRFPEPEGSRCPRPTHATDSRTLDTHREPSASAGRAARKDSEEPLRHPGMAVPFEEEPHTIVQGGQRSDFFGESIPPCLTLEDSPESDFTAMTSPEMYDYFFCDDPLEEGGKTGEGRGVSVADQELPEMYGPEMYEYFFNEVVEVRGKGGRGDKDTALETFSSDCRLAPPGGTEDLDSTATDDAMHISVPEVYEHFFASSAKDKRNWRAVFLSVPASEAKKAVRALKSLLCRPARHFQPKPTVHGAMLRRGSQGRLVLLAPNLLDKSQPRPEELRMAVMEPEKPLQPVFTQRDMCLGFMAFASWAVKTSDLQAPDAWKIVLLANFGTFSAIRYFRRQIITEGQHRT
ncbi:PGC-1 and ERR-induced regulator in muscle protein 1 [Elgaria multicarinata webbii]|uniref:PGC-1 and ERR-induced regulator in muscle protein 1 n=1 Tax=Elgaria multicarinata webbii TaxID=159646 RepID=UPI002FCCD435